MGWGSYVTRLVKNLRVFDSLYDLTRSCYMVALDMDVFSSMQLVEKRDYEYMLDDGALPVDDLYVVKGHDIPASEIPPIPVDLEAEFRRTQQ